MRAKHCCWLASKRYPSNNVIITDNNYISSATGSAHFRHGIIRSITVVCLHWRTRYNDASPLKSSQDFSVLKNIKMRIFWIAMIPVPPAFDGKLQPSKPWKKVVFFWVDCAREDIFAPPGTKWKWTGIIVVISNNSKSRCCNNCRSSGSRCCSCTSTTLLPPLLSLFAWWRRDLAHPFHVTVYFSSVLLLPILIFFALFLFSVFCSTPHCHRGEVLLVFGDIDPSMSVK